MLFKHCNPYTNSFQLETRSFCIGGRCIVMRQSPHEVEPDLALPHLKSTGTAVWDASFVLAEYLHRSEIRGKRVVELGCGLALPSLAAALAGATAVATDGDPSVLDLTAVCIRDNKLIDTVSTQVLLWGDPVATAAILKTGPVDVVVLADLLYNRAVFPQLLATTAALDAELVFIAHKNRGLGEQIFLKQLGRLYALELVPAAELHEEFRSHGIDIIVGRRCVSVQPSMPVEVEVAHQGC